MSRLTNDSSTPQALVMPEERREKREERREMREERRENRDARSEKREERDKHDQYERAQGRNGSVLEWRDGKEKGWPLGVAPKGSRQLGADSMA